MGIRWQGTVYLSKWFFKLQFLGVVLKAPMVGKTFPPKPTLFKIFDIITIPWYNLFSELIAMLNHLSLTHQNIPTSILNEV